MNTVMITSQILLQGMAGIFTAMLVLLLVTAVLNRLK